MKITQERLGVFGDAVIAIILTLMALELPIDIHNGKLDYINLFKSIGVYGVSFCYIASLWIQHVTIFSDDKKVKNPILVLDLIFIFVLSLIPTFTKAMFEDVALDTVAVYGGLYFLVNLLFNWIRGQVITQKEIEKNLPDQLRTRYRHIFIRRNLVQIGLNLVVILTVFISPVIALSLLTAFTVYGFFSNMQERAGFDDFLKLPVTTQEVFFNLNPEQLARFKQIISEYVSSVDELRHNNNRNREEYRKQWQKLSETMQNEFNLSEKDVGLWFRYGKNIMHLARGMRSQK